jgi:hypothetical protein
MSVKHFHVESRQELAELIIKCAPVGARTFALPKRLPPKGYLVEYNPKEKGLSLKKLAEELRLPWGEKKVQFKTYSGHAELWHDIRVNKIRQYGGYCIR